MQSRNTPACCCTLNMHDATIAQPDHTAADGLLAWRELESSRSASNECVQPTTAVGVQSDSDNV